jgi:4-amino-4-deoxy-L-arabinose transferase-like glycosyltransferase
MLTSPTSFNDIAKSPNILRRRRCLHGDSWLYAILLLALVLRSYHFAYPAWDYHNWRQTITLMIARDFARHGFPVLHPQVAWIGNQPSDPSYFSAEFSIESALAALLYKTFGESDVAARSVIVAFSLVGIVCLYNLLERRAGRMTARFAAFIYALLPYHLFFGRVFMPDVPAITLALASLDVLDRWTDNRKAGCLVGAGVLTALAVLQKPRMILVLMPALYLFWLAYGKSLPRRREPYIFVLIACLPELVWFVHGVSMEAHTAVGAFNIPRELFAHHLELWIQRSYLHRIIVALAFEAFSPVGLGLAVVGWLLPARNRAVWVARWWIVGGALVLLPIPGVIPENLYYLAMLLPAGSALAGVALSRMRGHFRAIVLGVFAAGAIYSVIPLYQPDRMPYDLGILLKSLSSPADLLATETGGSPNVLYYADRRGWLLNEAYDVERVQHLRHAGARYYVDTFLGDFTRHRQFFQTMDTRFQRLTGDDAPWQIYDLGATPGPLQFPTGDIPSSQTVTFGEQIQFRGASLRPLIGWPGCFEVINYWRCLKPLATDVQVSVHITDSAGQIVAQQQHGPQGGWFPTSKWTAGDLVRERYVLALPGSLPGGKYQIWVGWVDPMRRQPLSILNPTASEQAYHAEIAEIDARRPPRYGWFSPD